MRITQRPNRIAGSRLPTHAFHTYSILAPYTTHFRKATCDEAGCEAYRNGWNYHIESLDASLYYAATHAGKKYHVVKMGENDSYLVFDPGQPCFAEDSHTVRIDRPEIFVAGRGDSRSYIPQRAVRYDRYDQWVDDFATNLDSIRTRLERG
jgi:hypothetical protein